MEMVEEINMEKLHKKQLFLFDIDGTLALGNSLLEGSKELLFFLRKMGKNVYFTTNNSTRSRRDFVDYFAQWGIDVEEESFFTAGEMTRVYCKKNWKDQKIFLIGTPSVRAELERDGLQITEVYEEDVACVLVTFDTSLRYEKLEIASRILMEKDVAFIATNPDLCCPTSFGAIPDCGSICTMLEHATGKKPRYIGKPEPEIVHECRRLSGASKEETLLIGDRIYTDMLCAKNAGVDGLLVLSGEATNQDAMNCGFHIPYVFQDVEKLKNYLMNK